MVYERLYERPQFPGGFERVTTSFGIVSRELGGQAADDPLVLIKQRNGRVPNPWKFDLPGGIREPEDSTLESALEREMLEELHLRTGYYRRIGKPMWEVVADRKMVIEYHLFWVTAFGPPKESDEAINIAYVGPESAGAFKIVGFDEQRRIMGAMATMIFDGFSVLGRPFYQGLVTPEIAAAAEDLGRRSYSLLDGGRYFGRLEDSGTVSLYRRLNPFEPRGYFEGSLEHLAAV